MEDTAVPPVRTDRFARRALLAGIVGTAAAAVAVPKVTAAAQDVSVKKGQAAVGGRTLDVTIYAVALPDGNFAYGYTPETASIPGPTLEMVEGDTLRLRVINQTGRVMSAHPHGVDYDIQSDGSLQTNTAIPAGEERTYIWRSHEGGMGADGVYTPGSAGYWHYHDHALNGSAHGTEGIRRGLYGALIVRRAGDPLPDVQNIVVINDANINNKVAPNTPTFTARQGQRVEWVVIAHGNSFHTFSLKGHRWANNRTGLISGPDDGAQIVDTRTVGPADSFGFQVIAGERVGPGRFEYHTHVALFWDRGVYGWFDVLESPAPVVTVTGIADGETYGDSLTKTVSWTVTGGAATGASSATLDGQPLENGAALRLWTLPLGQHELVVVGKGTGGDTTTTVRFTTKTSFADLQALVTSLPMSETTRAGLLDRVTRAAGKATSGSESGAISLLEQFISRVENQVRSNAEVRSVLLRDAQALIAELGALDAAEGGR
ncbi:multicopper oxidase domain-containing protein [Motilibacter deserti]|uniref:Multicopper oxidase domain-containing protein n=1 Tax=Motilibacter deserti TaxID=2714956 RepID=A0ABX0GTJ1_9ACTN|nr:multicopper oxidase domain-containing protein [Motilibacter deserti]NHC14224.1 multicopper oxidase domain-containing protein [Motilibacter deserti]